MQYCNCAANYALPYVANSNVSKYTSLLQNEFSYMKSNGILLLYQILVNKVSLHRSAVV